MKSNTVVRIFLLIVGNALAILLALLVPETTPGRAHNRSHR